MKAKAFSETGESSASINARIDDANMKAVTGALREGALLYQPKSGLNYYVRRGAEIDGMASLTPARWRQF